VQEAGKQGGEGKEGQILHMREKEASSVDRHPENLDVW
jgi:hypothetical protein